VVSRSNFTTEDLDRSQANSGGFMVYKVSLRQVFSPEYISFPLSISLHQCSIHIHSSVTNDLNKLRNLQRH